MAHLDAASSQDWLVGGGAMAKAIRAVDWSLTPLGPMESWPQSLRTTLSLVQASSWPIGLVWGPGHVQIYNDGYRPICGAKHPTSMGQDFRACWASAFPVIGEAYASAWAGKSAYLENMRMFLDRLGFLEETWFTFSFSPITDESGGVGGLFHPVTEMTSQMLSERRTKTLRDLAVRAGKATTTADAFALSAAVLAESDLDLPFVLFYSIEGDASHARLVGQTGLAAGTPASPALVDFGERGDPCWPIAEVVRTGAASRTDGVDARLAGMTVGPYPELPATAFALPITRAGSDQPAGVMIAGVSARLPVDDAYRGFFDFVAAAVSSALANARAHEEERGRADALAEIDRAKTAFFTNASHELRTPLTLILGPLEDELAELDSPLPAPRRERLKTAHRNSQRLLKLVNALLSFSSIESRAPLRPAYEATDLSADTRELASAFRSAIEKAGLTLTIDCAPLPEAVFVDREMWEKIVLNLVSNAFKCTFDGAIEVRLRGGDDHAELTVKDTGIGIPDSELPHLFERFHRVRGARTRSFEGSGIGLALVNDLVRLHSGTLRVESEVGRGTTFTVRIPRGGAHLSDGRVHTTRPPAASGLAAAPYVEEALRWLPGAESAAPHPSLGPSATATPGAGPSARILVAEDNADMRDYIAGILRSRWSVETVADGVAALAAARRARPDLIVADVMMPELDGFGLLRALRADPATRDVPAVMLSARAGEDARIEGLERGADDYLVKPFSARELCARVATHLQLGRLRAAEERERRRLFDVFEQAPMPIAVLVGDELRFEVANPAYCSMLGRSDFVGKTVRAAFPELGEHESIASLQRVFRTGEATRAAELLIPMVRDGVSVDTYFDYVAQPVRDGAGAVTGVMVLAVDVTERRLARGRDDARRSSAEGANRAKDEFLAMLGHELRNPLAPIVTALQVMRLRDGSHAESKELLVVDRQVKHLVRLVDDLLDVARIAQGKIQLDRRPVELATVVADAVEIASPLLELHRHHLDVQVRTGGLRVDADRTRLAQVVSNLLTNAAKYTPSGGHITVRGRVDEGEIELSVTDDGVGIRPEMLSRIFELFAQEWQTMDRSIGGLGLGLAIVKNLVALHGGRVFARSEGLGRGSELVVRLPPSVANADSVALASPAETSAFDGSAASRGGLRILIVDDNIDAAAMLDEWLTAEGHDTRVAHDGAEAFRVVEQFVPDVVLLDIGLPVMNGYEVVRRLREGPRLAATTFIAVTGYGQQSDRARSAEAGFDVHLVKPIDLDVFERLIAARAARGGAARA